MLKLWFLLVEVMKVMVEVFYRVGKVIIKESIVEIKVVVMLEEMVCILLRMLPSFISDLIVMPSQERSRLRLLMLSLQVLFSL